MFQWEARLHVNLCFGVSRDGTPPECYLQYIEQLKAHFKLANAASSKKTTDKA